MSLTIQTTRKGSLQGRITWKDGRPSYNTGFAQYSTDELIILSKEGPRKKPFPLDVSNSTALLFEQYTKRDTDAVIDFQYSTYRGPLQGVVGEVNYLEVLPPNRVYVELLNKIKEQTINLAVFCAEFPETVRAFVKIARYLAQWKKRVPRTLWKWFTTQRTYTSKGHVVTSLRDSTITDDMAELLLTFDYSIRPVVSDMFGAIEFLKKKLDEGYPRYIKARATEEIDSTTTSTHGLYGPLAPFTVEQRAEYSIRLVAKVIVTDPNRATLSQLGISNPLAAGWELLPFSFVVDAIVPIGTYLQSIDALKGVTGVYQESSFTSLSNTYEPQDGSGYYSTIRNNKRRALAQSLTELYGAAFTYPAYEPSTSLRSAMDMTAVLRKLSR